jgi:hypothetical protein
VGSVPGKGLHIAHSPVWRVGAGCKQLVGDAVL